MPKHIKSIPPRAVGEEADVSHFVGKWKTAQSGLTKEELVWLAQLARRPRLAGSTSGFASALQIQDGLTPDERAIRFTRLFMAHPDEAASFWTAARDWTRRKVSKLSKLEKAREAVRDLEFESKLANAKLSKSSLNSWLDNFGQKEDYAAAKEDLEELFASLPPPGWRFTAKDVERYLEYRYGGEWSSTVEDAIQAERGNVSGKKRR